jgi:hypothetical protein
MTSRIKRRHRIFRHSPFIKALCVLEYIPDMSKASIMSVVRRVQKARKARDFEPYEERGKYVLSKRAFKRLRQQNYDLHRTRKST